VFVVFKQYLKDSFGTAGLSPFLGQLGLLWKKHKRANRFPIGVLKLLW